MTSYISIIINKLIKIYKIKYLGKNVTKINDIIPLIFNEIMMRSAFY